MTSACKPTAGVVAVESKNRIIKVDFSCNLTI